MLRTRILPKMLNSEVESYLSANDIIIVPVGTVELHGGMPLDCETVVSEAIGLKMAEAADGLLLTGLPYFYAGATAIGRGTVQVNIRQGIDYLGAIARSLLRQGFKRQIYLSFHGPAHMTICPMVRDFFDETGVPILYFDNVMSMAKQFQSQMRAAGDAVSNDPSAFLKVFDQMIVGAYDIMGRLDDVPLSREYFHTQAQTTSQFEDLFQLAYQSGSVGYYFGDVKDHASTTPIPDAATRSAMASAGRAAIGQFVAGLDMPHIVSQMRCLETFEREVAKRYPWVPSAASLQD